MKGCITYLDAQLSRVWRGAAIVAVAAALLIAFPAHQRLMTRCANDSRVLGHDTCTMEGAVYMTLAGIFVLTIIAVGCLAYAILDFVRWLTHSNTRARFRINTQTFAVGASTLLLVILTVSGYSP